MKTLERNDEKRSSALPRVRLCYGPLLDLWFPPDLCLVPTCIPVFAKGALMVLQPMRSQADERLMAKKESSSNDSSSSSSKAGELRLRARQNCTN